MKPYFLYPGIVFFIAIWWLIAFFPHASVEHAQPVLPQLPVPPLPGISRDDLRQALQGDTQLQAQLINEWAYEAQLLGAPFLPAEKLLRASQLARAIHVNRNESEEKTVVDDVGNTLQITSELQYFLPQTELAATVLLALVPPDQIVALPRRLRQQDLFPEALLDRITLNGERHNAEAIALQRPDVAFVAHYTQPSTLQTLREQGIKLFALTRIHTIPELETTIQKLGSVVHREEEAELLAIFMEAGFQALENSLLDKPISNERILYLNHYAQFSVPSEKRLAGQLLARLGINHWFKGKGGDQWQIGLSSEEVAALSPTCLILSTADRSLRDRMMQNPLFQSVPAIQAGHLYAVDENVQESPTQFLLLAYYDLVTILKNREVGQ